MIEYVQRIWAPAVPRWMPVIVDIMRPDDATYWHRRIQPSIRELPDRADRNWNWPLFRVAFPIAQRAAGHRCLALTISLANSAGRGVPAGMLLLIENYPWLAPRPWERLGERGPRKGSTFTWFLSAAPTARLRELGVSEPPPLGAVLIDTALVASMNLGHQGRMWLHATPIGGPRLLDFYLKRGLSRVNAGFRIPKALWPMAGQRSDGRHFYATSRIAKVLLNALNTQR
jgi:hypothetical protein